MQLYYYYSLFMFTRCSIVHHTPATRHRLSVCHSLSPFHFLELALVLSFTFRVRSTNGNTQDYPGSFLLFTTATATALPIELNRWLVFFKRYKRNLVSLKYSMGTTILLSHSNSNSLTFCSIARSLALFLVSSLSQRKMKRSTRAQSINGQHNTQMVTVQLWL